jgi:hypothetical protein
MQVAMIPLISCPVKDDRDLLNNRRIYTRSPLSWMYRWFNGVLPNTRSLCSTIVHSVSQSSSVAMTYGSHDLSEMDANKLTQKKLRVRVKIAEHCYLICNRPSHIVIESSL